MPDQISEGIQETRVDNIQKLKELVASDTKTSVVLDKFEKEYIPDTPESDATGFDAGIILFSELPQKMIAEDEFSPTMIDLENAGDERLDGFPEYIRAHLALDDKGELGHSQFRKFPEDPLWSRYWRVVEKYSQKIFGIVEKNPKLVEAYGRPDQSYEDKIKLFKEVWNDYRAVNYSVLLGEVKEKSIGKDLVASGEWLGSGTFVDNIIKSLDSDSKLKSFYHLLNSGGTYEDVKGVNSGDLHKAFIFFFHWRRTNEQYRKGLDTVGKYGTYNGGSQIVSDVGVFFPIDTVVSNQLSIGSFMGNKSTSEFFITKTPEVISNQKWLSAEELKQLASKDQTEIPLSEAYFRADTWDALGRLMSKFKEKGFDEEWINEHIYTNEPNPSSEDFKRWLEERKYKKVKVKPYVSVQHDHHNFLWVPEDKK